MLNKGYGGSRNTGLPVQHKYSRKKDVFAYVIPSLSDEVP
jgi:hypothetical protein